MKHRPGVGNHSFLITIFPVSLIFWAISAKLVPFDVP